MTDPCATTNGEPRLCSVHHCALIYQQIPIDRFQPNLGTVACLVCPVSNAIVTEPKDSA